MVDGVMENVAETGEVLDGEGAILVATGAVVSFCFGADSRYRAVDRMPGIQPCTPNLRDAPRMMLLAVPLFLVAASSASAWISGVSLRPDSERRGR